MSEAKNEVRDMTEDTTHFYLSTACHHGLHERCRKACKFCGTSCSCQCHATVVRKQMSDLIERLRKRKEFFLNGHVWLMSSQPDTDCAEAADEIERLSQLQDETHQLCADYAAKAEVAETLLRNTCKATIAYLDAPEGSPILWPVSRANLHAMLRSAGRLR